MLDFGNERQRTGEVRIEVEEELASLWLIC